MGKASSGRQMVEGGAVRERWRYRPRNQSGVFCSSRCSGSLSIRERFARSAESLIVSLTTEKSNPKGALTGLLQTNVRLSRHASAGTIRERN